LILGISGKIVANYWLSHVYPSEVGNAHRNGDYHIHDLDMFAGYCAGWSLRQLLEEGFNGLDNRVQSAPPRNLQAAVNQMINFFGTLQNEWAGAQAFSSFDTYLAPFVHKFEMELEDDMKLSGATFESEEKRKAYIDLKTYKYVKQQLQNFIFGLNVPSRWGTQTPFTNITLDWTCPEDLKEKSLMLGGIESGYYHKKFSELEKEMKLINRVLIEVYTAGDRNGAVFTFPIPTYNITEDFPRDDPDIEKLFEMTAKYGIPYFQNFIGSQFKVVKDENGNTTKVENPNAYKPGAVRSMCCRLQLDLTQLEKRGGGLFGSAEMTGSIGVVTLNLARIGYNFK
jgi:ribonucleoside-triphosphate reductase